MPVISDPEDTIYEFMVNEKGEWEHWKSRVADYVYPIDSVPEYAGILIPNVDNTRTEFLINTISKQDKAVLLIGEPVSDAYIFLEK